MSVNLNDLAQKLREVSISFGFDPNNKNFVVYDIIQKLQEGDLGQARISCLQEAGRITNDDLREWIVENLYQGEENHPWRLLWQRREDDKKDPDF